MRPRHKCEEKCRFDSSVGSSPDDRNKSRGLSIVINHDRYNTLDGPLILKVI